MDNFSTKIIKLNNTNRFFSKDDYGIYQFGKKYFSLESITDPKLAKTVSPYGFISLSDKLTGAIDKLISANPDTTFELNGTSGNYVYATLPDVKNFKNMQIGDIPQKLNEFGEKDWASIVKRGDNQYALAYVNFKVKNLNEKEYGEFLQSIRTLIKNPNDISALKTYRNSFEINKIESTKSSFLVPDTELMLTSRKTIPQLIQTLTPDGTVTFDKADYYEIFSRMQSYNISMASGAESTVNKDLLKMSMEKVENLVPDSFSKALSLTEEYVTAQGIKNDSPFNEISNMLYSSYQDFNKVTGYEFITSDNNPEIIQKKLGTYFKTEFDPSTKKISSVIAYNPNGKINKEITDEIKNLLKDNSLKVDREGLVERINYHSSRFRHVASEEDIIKYNKYIVENVLTANGDEKIKNANKLARTIVGEQQVKMLDSFGLRDMFFKKREKFTPKEYIKRFYDFYNKLDFYDRVSDDLAVLKDYMDNNLHIGVLTGQILEGKKLDNYLTVAKQSSVISGKVRMTSQSFLHPLAQINTDLQRKAQAHDFFRKFSFINKDGQNISTSELSKGFISSLEEYNYKKIKFNYLEAQKYVNKNKHKIGINVVPELYENQATILYTESDAAWQDSNRFTKTFAMQNLSVKENKNPLSIKYNSLITDNVFKKSDGTVYTTEELNELFSNIYSQTKNSNNGISISDLSLDEDAKKLILKNILTEEAYAAFENSRAYDMEKEFREIGSGFSKIGKIEGNKEAFVEESNNMATKFKNFTKKFFIEADAASSISIINPNSVISSQNTRIKGSNFGYISDVRFTNKGIEIVTDHILSQSEGSKVLIDNIKATTQALDDLIFLKLKNGKELFVEGMVNEKMTKGSRGFSGTYFARSLQTMAIRSITSPLADGSDINPDGTINYQKRFQNWKNYMTQSKPFGEYIGSNGKTKLKGTSNIFELFNIDINLTDDLTLEFSDKTVNKALDNYDEVDGSSLDKAIVRGMNEHLKKLFGRTGELNVAEAAYLGNYATDLMFSTQEEYVKTLDKNYADAARVIVKNAELYKSYISNGETKFSKIQDLPDGYSYLWISNIRMMSESKKRLTDEALKVGRLSAIVAQEYGLDDLITVIKEKGNDAVVDFLSDYLGLAAEKNSDFARNTDFFKNRFGKNIISLSSDDISTNDYSLSDDFQAYVKNSPIGKKLDFNFEKGKLNKKLYGQLKDFNAEFMDEFQQIFNFGDGRKTEIREINNFFGQLFLQSFLDRNIFANDKFTYEDKKDLLNKISKLDLNTYGLGLFDYTQHMTNPSHVTLSSFLEGNKNHLINILKNQFESGSKESEQNLLNFFADKYKKVHQGNNFNERAFSEFKTKLYSYVYEIKKYKKFKDYNNQEGFFKFIATSMYGKEAKYWEDFTASKYGFVKEFDNFLSGIDNSKINYISNIFKNSKVSQEFDNTLKFFANFGLSYLNELYSQNKDNKFISTRYSNSILNSLSEKEFSKLRTSISNFNLDKAQIKNIVDYWLPNMLENNNIASIKSLSSLLSDTELFSGENYYNFSELSEFLKYGNIPFIIDQFAIDDNGKNVPNKTLSTLEKIIRYNDKLNKYTKEYNAISNGLNEENVNKAKDETKKIFDELLGKQKITKSEFDMYNNKFYYFYNDLHKNFIEETSNKLLYYTFMNDKYIDSVTGEGNEVLFRNSRDIKKLVYDSMTDYVNNKINNETLNVSSNMIKSITPERMYVSDNIRSFLSQYKGENNLSIFDIFEDINVITKQIKNNDNDQMLYDELIKIKEELEEKVGKTLRGVLKETQQEYKKIFSSNDISHDVLKNIFGSISNSYYGYYVNVFNKFSKNGSEDEYSQKLLKNINKTKKTLISLLTGRHNGLVDELFSKGGRISEFTSLKVKNSAAISPREGSIITSFIKEEMLDILKQKSKTNITPEELENVEKSYKKFQRDLRLVYGSDLVDELIEEFNEKYISINPNSGEDFYLATVNEIKEKLDNFSHIAVGTFEDYSRLEKDRLFKNNYRETQVAYGILSRHPHQYKSSLTPVRYVMFNDNDLKSGFISRFYNNGVKMPGTQSSLTFIGKRTALSAKGDFDGDVFQIMFIGDRDLKKSKYLDMSKRDFLDLYNKKLKLFQLMNNVAGEDLEEIFNDTSIINSKVRSGKIKKYKSLKRQIESVFNNGKELSGNDAYKLIELDYLSLSNEKTRVLKMLADEIDEHRTMPEVFGDITLDGFDFKVSKRALSYFALTLKDEDRAAFYLNKKKFSHKTKLKNLVLKNTQLPEQFKNELSAIVEQDGGTQFIMGALNQLRNDSKVISWHLLFNSINKFLDDAGIAKTGKVHNTLTNVRETYTTLLDVNEFKKMQKYLSDHSDLVSDFTNINPEEFINTLRKAGMNHDIGTLIEKLAVSAKKGSVDPTKKLKVFEDVQDLLFNDEEHSINFNFKKAGEFVVENSKLNLKGGIYDVNNLSKYTSNSKVPTFINWFSSFYDGEFDVDLAKQFLIMADVDPQLLDDIDYANIVDVLGKKGKLTHYDLTTLIGNWSLLMFKGTLQRDLRIKELNRNQYDKLLGNTIGANFWKRMSTLANMVIKKDSVGTRAEANTLVNANIEDVKARNIEKAIEATEETAEITENDSVNTLEKQVNEAKKTLNGIKEQLKIIETDIEVPQEVKRVEEEIKNKTAPDGKRSPNSIKAKKALFRQMSLSEVNNNYVEEISTDNTSTNIDTSINNNKVEQEISNVSDNINETISEESKIVNSSKVDNISEPVSENINKINNEIKGLSNEEVEQLRKKIKELEEQLECLGNIDISKDREISKLKRKVDQLKQANIVHKAREKSRKFTEEYFGRVNDKVKITREAINSNPNIAKYKNKAIGAAGIGALALFFRIFQKSRPVVNLDINEQEYERSQGSIYRNLGQYNINTNIRSLY